MSLTSPSSSRDRKKYGKVWRRSINFFFSLLLRCDLSTSTSLCLQHEPYPAIFISVTNGRRWRQRHRKTRFSSTSFPGSFLYFLEVEKGPWERGWIFVRFYFTLCYLMLAFPSSTLPDAISWSAFLCDFIFWSKRVLVFGTFSQWFLAKSCSKSR